MKVDQKRSVPQRSTEAPGHTGGIWSSEYDGSVAIAGVICIPRNCLGQDGTSREERMANSRLIAAAPELLDACKKAHHWMMGGGEMPDRAFEADLCRSLTQAIAKATNGGGA